MVLHTVLWNWDGLSHRHLSSEFSNMRVTCFHQPQFCYELSLIFLILVISLVVSSSFFQHQMYSFVLVKTQLWLICSSSTSSSTFFIVKGTKPNVCLDILSKFVIDNLGSLTIIIRFFVDIVSDASIFSSTTTAI